MLRKPMDDRSRIRSLRIAEVAPLLVVLLTAGFAAAAADLTSTNFRLRFGHLNSGAVVAAPCCPATPMRGTLGETGAGPPLVAPSGASTASGFRAAVAFSSFCGNGLLEAAEDCDDGGTAAGDGCSATCEDENIWVFTGTAVGGFLIAFTIDGVEIEITTTAGQTAAQVAIAVAAAINADLALQALGTAASSDGDRVITNGTVTQTTIGDPGLGHVTEVPALGAPALLVSIGVLSALAVGGIRRRTRSGPEANHGRPSGGGTHA
jgi:cysteine-rich repeat protein